jgi:hypothetical protein
MWRIYKGAGSDLREPFFRHIPQDYEKAASGLQESVRNYMRFTAAKVGGRAVKQLVRQPFVFNLAC